MIPNRLARCVLVAMAVLAFAAGTAHGADKIVFKTDFPPVGYHATYYAAAGRGLYERSGLDVDILPGTGSQSAIRAVMADGGNRRSDGRGCKLINLRRVIQEGRRWV